jgi:hypothetical protein
MTNASMAEKSPRVVKAHSSTTRGYHDLRFVTLVDGSVRIVTCGTDNTVAIRKDIHGEPLHVFSSGMEDISFTGIATHPSALQWSVSDEEHFVKVRIDVCCLEARGPRPSLPLVSAVGGPPQFQIPQLLPSLLRLPRSTTKTRRAQTWRRGRRSPAFLSLHVR